MAFQWYAIQVYSGSEQAVKRGIESIAKEYKLEDKIASIIVPTEEVIEVKNGEKKITERSLYPGYVFANLDLDTVYGIKFKDYQKFQDLLEREKTLHH